MVEQWDRPDPAADDEAVELATRIREGGRLDVLLGAIADHDDRIVHRALQLLVELDREFLVDLTTDAVVRLTGAPSS